MKWDFASVFSNTDALLAGAAGTLRIFAICLVAGLSLGLVVGLARYSKRRLFYIPASVFMEFFRNTPVLVQILWFYF
ncbi:MAG: amino acid transporter permease, partial [Ramlibacter sp.]|nr:amino acid transporter permease [Ramlibacter sp.]